ncbi:MAG: hypothetical protein PHY48_11795 [Candidatus Cloacimonetes bacterium]|nr:hypothetical protein [Candidatus Cloacimonadota bacterium]
MTSSKRKIYITDQELKLGRIVFEDNPDTIIMKFPATYESGNWSFDHR